MVRVLYYYMRMIPPTTLDGLYQERILVFGASGFLGTHIFDEFSKKTETIGTFFSASHFSKKNLYKLDASNFNDLNYIIDHVAPSVIVNCIGLTDVEVCELRPEASWKLNAAVPSHIAKLAKVRKIKFIHISTDHFSSEIDRPRSETELMTPINQYGFSKLQAEKSILLYNPDSLILRTNFFGHSVTGKKSILDFALSSFSRGQFFAGFDDVVFSPVGIHEVSRFLLSENAQHSAGILNLASSRPISKYEFMLLVARATGYSESQVRRSEIKSSDLKVRRPSYLALDPTRLTQELSYSLPTIELMLRAELAAVV